MVSSHPSIEVAEACVRRGRNTGTAFLDNCFRGLLRTLLRAHPALLESANLEWFVRQFEQTKRMYRGEDDDGAS